MPNLLFLFFFNLHLGKKSPRLCSCCSRSCHRCWAWEYAHSCATHCCYLCSNCCCNGYFYACACWCGAHLGGSKSNAVKLILRLFLYHFLHTMSLYVTSPSTTTQTSNKHHHHGDGAARPSSSMDSINPHRPSGGRPCAYIFRGRCQRVLVESIN